MSWKYDPYNDNLQFVPVPEVKVKNFIKAILLDSKQDVEFPVASILFDVDSILYNDDEDKLNE
jgi:hypothetical protein